MAMYWDRIAPTEILPIVVIVTIIQHKVFELTLLDPPHRLGSNVPYFAVNLISRLRSFVEQGNLHNVNEGRKTEDRIWNIPFANDKLSANGFHN